MAVVLDKNFIGTRSNSERCGKRNSASLKFDVKSEQRKFKYLFHAWVVIN